MAGAGSVYSGLKVRGLDSLHIVTEENPSCHLPHVHGNVGPDVAYGLFQIAVAGKEIDEERKGKR